MPIAWHPSRWWDWCVTEDEKSSHPKVNSKASRQRSENSAFLKAEGGCHNTTSPTEYAQDHDFVSGDWIQKII